MTNEQFDKYVFQNLTMLTDTEKMIKLIKKIEIVSKDIREVNGVFIYYDKIHDALFTFDPSKEFPESIRHNCKSIMHNEFINRRFPKKENPYIVIRCLLARCKNVKEICKKLYDILNDQLDDNDFEDTPRSYHYCSFYDAFVDVLKFL